jgi:hypothetical protein
MAISISFEADTLGSHFSTIASLFFSIWNIDLMVVTDMTLESATRLQIVPISAVLRLGRFMGGSGSLHSRRNGKLSIMEP